MFTAFGEQAEISKESISDLFNLDSAYLSTLDLNGERFKSTPATRSLNKHKYLSEDDTHEDLRPLAYFVKIQSHNADNPT